MMSNVPIYRAKKINSDEYVEGDLISGKYIKPLYQSWTIDTRALPYTIEHGKLIEIDSSTLAIHFPDMIDSEGTKIFASLSENGKGGDILNSIRNNHTDVLVYDTQFELKNIGMRPKYSRFKVIGIQQ